MKFTTILLMAAFLQVSAKTYSQKVTLNFKNVPIQTVLKEINRQTDFQFFYKDALLKTIPKISVNVKNANLEDALQECFKSVPINFRIDEKTIVLKTSTVTTTNSINEVVELSLQDLKGVILDEDGKPLSGVSVTIKGKAIGTSTNNKGEFELINLGANETLVISSVGYESKSISIGNRTYIKVVLIQEKKDLDEVSVVSTGYQDIPKERVTGSFTNITSVELERSNSFNLKDRLEGLVPGMYFEPQFDEDQSPNGDRSRSIVIRGVGTFGNNNPLIVIDGAPFYSGVVDPFSLINPSDVESISVLKDAAAASIWGSQAANGVIVITTKKGRLVSGQPMVNFSLDYLVQPAPNLKDIPWASSKDALTIYKNIINDQTWFDQFLDPIFKDRYELPEVMDVLIKMKQGTLLQADGNNRLDELSKIDVRDEFADLFFRKLESNKKINMSFQTGTVFNQVRTSITASFNNQYARGNSDFQINANFNDEYKPKKWLTVSFGANYFMSNQKNNGVVVNDLTGIPQMSQILDDQGNYLPMSLNNSTDSYYDVPTWRRRDTAAKYRLPYDWDWNLKRDVDNYDKSRNTSNLRLNTNIKVTPFVGFDVNFFYQYQKDHIISNEYYNEQSWYVRNLVNNNARVDGSYPLPPGGMLYENQTDGFSHNARLQMAYTKTYGQHAIRAIAGMEIRQNVYDYRPYGYYGFDPQSLTAISSLDFLSTITPKMNGDAAGFGNYGIPAIPTQRFGITLRGNDDRYVSKYANVGYTYKRTYDLTGSIRQDITNLFGQSADYTNLPQWSVGIGWKIDNEKFFKSKIISNLKMRASYGFNGNIDKTASPYIFGYPWIDPLLGIPYTAVQSAPNPGLTWEKTGTYNIGLDYGFLNNRYSGSIEYYSKKAVDVLAQIAVNGTYGYQNNRATLNSGNISNKGLEFNINARIIEKGPVLWQSRFNFGTNRNRATKITQVNTGTIAYTTLSFYYHLPNQPVDFVAAATWKGYDSLGYDKFEYQGNTLSIRDVTNFAAMKQADIFKVVGQRSPKYFGQWGNTVSYKNFDLNLSLLYKFGHVFIKDYPASSMASTYFSPSNFFTFLPNMLVDSWKSPADGNSASMYSTLNKLTNSQQINALNSIARYNTRNVLNAGSVRIQSISLSYRLPSKIAPVFKNARLQLEARNLGPLYVANKEGIDPDFPPYSSSPYGALQYVIRNRAQYSASLKFGL